MPRCDSSVSGSRLARAALTRLRMLARGRHAYPPFHGSREHDLGCLGRSNETKKGFHNDLSRRQQRIAQASVRKAVWMAGSRS
jgi:hypothetical protein